MPHGEGDRPKRDNVKRLVRGSTLLLFGRLLSKLSNFVIQVLIVRYLSQSAFGGFAYALSVATLAQAVMILGLDRSIVRFLPIYHEQRDHRKVIGTIVMSLGVILALGLAAILVLYGFQGLIANWIKDPQALSLLLVLIFLAPLQALDDLLIHLFAIFAKPRSIFFRRYVLAPALKIMVVLALILSGSDVFFLAFGYIAATLVGVGIYGVLLIKLLREQGLLARVTPGGLDMPWREIFSFTFPLLVSELALVGSHTLSVVLLGHFWGTPSVASLRAVQPTARLNELVMASFATLFTPLASRLHSREDRAAINDLYWKSALWIAVFSFPIFALTFSLAQPLTILLFGARYQDSAPILALMAFGYYFNAALGFNGLTLKVLGRVRYMLIISLVTAVIGCLSAFLLIPRMGALGAGIATAITLVVHNLLKQAGLLGTGIGVFDWRYLRAYAVITLAAVGVLVIQLTTSPSVTVGVGLGVLAILLVVVLNARMLDLQQNFPEAMKLPGMKLLTSARWGGRARPSIRDRQGSPERG